MSQDKTQIVFSKTAKITICCTKDKKIYNTSGFKREGWPEFYTVTDFESDPKAYLAKKSLMDVVELIKRGEITQDILKSKRVLKFSSYIDDFPYLLFWSHDPVENCYQVLLLRYPIELPFWHNAFSWEFVPRGLNTFPLRKESEEKFARWLISKCANLDCHNLAKGACGQCQKVKYCSAQCQKEDWFLHKNVCPILCTEHMALSNLPTINAYAMKLNSTRKKLSKDHTAENIRLLYRRFCETVSNLESDQLLYALGYNDPERTTNWMCTFQENDNIIMRTPPQSEDLDSHYYKTCKAFQRTIALLRDPESELDLSHVCLIPFDTANLSISDKHTFSRQLLSPYPKIAKMYQLFLPNRTGLYPWHAEMRYNGWEEILVSAFTPKQIEMLENRCGLSTCENKSSIRCGHCWMVRYCCQECMHHDQARHLPFCQLYDRGDPIYTDIYTMD